MVKYLNTEQAAEMLGVCTRTMERWRSDRTFSPVMRTVGGHSRYTVKQINDFKKKQDDKRLKNLLK